MAAGLFGKLPNRGDFLTRGLPRVFVEPWDAWLQGGMAASRGTLGEAAWLDRYLVAPIWHFALSAKLAGDSAWLGVMLPSVDRVGRYFPLTIAVPLAAGTQPLAALACAGDWSAAAESLGLAALAEELPPEALDAALNGLPAPAVAVGCEAVQPLQATSGIALIDNAYPGAAVAAARLCDAGIGQRTPNFSAFTTMGSEDLPATTAVHGELPPPGAFAALLDGDWASHGWSQHGGAEQQEVLV